MVFPLWRIYLFFTIQLLGNNKWFKRLTSLSLGRHTKQLGAAPAQVWWLMLVQMFDTQCW
jgi:hypothetical protein